MYFLLKMGIFHCYVSLPEGSTEDKIMTETRKSSKLRAIVFFRCKLAVSRGVVEEAALNMAKFPLSNDPYFAITLCEKTSYIIHVHILLSPSKRPRDKILSKRERHPFLKQWRQTILKKSLTKAHPIFFKTPSSSIGFPTSHQPFSDEFGGPTCQSVEAAKCLIPKMKSAKYTLPPRIMKVENGSFQH